MAVMLSGCSHHPTVSEANTRLIVQTQAHQIAGLTKSFSVVNEAVATIPEVLKTVDDDPPVESLPQLNLWLKANDCTKEEDWELCYSKTRLLLIKSTYQYDIINDQLYAAKKVIADLSKTLDDAIKSSQSAGTALTESLK